MRMVMALCDLLAAATPVRIGAFVHVVGTRAQICEATRPSAGPAYHTVAVLRRKDELVVGV